MDWNMEWRNGMGDQEETEAIELSDEMLEAIRILKSDGHPRQLEELKQSHAEILTRLNAKSEEKKDEAKEEVPENQGSGSDNTGGDVPVSDGPEPPPKIETPEVTPKDSTKVPWWERDTYRKE